MLDYKRYSDEELVVLIKQDDQGAFAELYDRFSGLLYIYSRKMTQDGEATEDIIQDIFISLWDKRNTLQLKGSMSSYLYTAVRYRFFDLVSRQKIRNDYVAHFQQYIDTHDSPTESYINEKELVELIEREISKLPEKMQEIFRLSRYEGLSHREIAQQLDISEKTVRNQINNALKILRKRLGAFAFFMMFFY